MDINADPKADDYFFARGMSFPVENREKVFPAGVKQANVTFFDGVKDVAVRNGKLTFTMDAPKATLGWGNYLGRQPLLEIQDMWQQENAVRLRVRQSGTKSQWSVALWGDGQPADLPGRVNSGVPTETAELSGGDWQELSFKPLHGEGPNPDGLEFTIAADKGTRFEIESLKLVQQAFEGYCRTEFVLPEGPIWRAVAEVGQPSEQHLYGYQEVRCRLYINGQFVRCRGPSHAYQSAPVDIARYLKPGRNCVGFYGFHLGQLRAMYLQARIVMQSGQIVEVASGPDWKYSRQEVDGWSRPGFNDSAWSNIAGGRRPNLTIRGYSHELAIPAYDRRLVIKTPSQNHFGQPGRPTGSEPPTGSGTGSRKPSRRDLFFIDAQDVLLDVHVPAGLKDQRPTLSYALGRADDEGKCTAVKDGSGGACAERDGSLVYRLNLGRQSPGVYALALGLQAADGSLIERRPREPLVVLGKIQQKTIAGTEYTEGLDLELEDKVDFTNPKDPHPWIESACAPRQDRMDVPAVKVDRPSLVRKGDLAYREVTDPNRGSGFSYRIEFKHPGSFYYLELEYPDDAKRTADVVISSKVEGVFWNSQAGTGFETGGRFLPTGRMQKLNWIHVADPGPHSVDVINVIEGARAAARSLKIYRLKGDLPAMPCGTQRSYGIHSERCFYSSGIGANFGVGMPVEDKSLRAGDAQRPPMRNQIKDLVWLFQTGQRYVQYLRFAGQNCHVMGCIQYDEYNNPFLPAPMLDDSRVLPCMKTMMANLFEANGIDFYAGLEFSQSRDVRTYANNAQAAKGADTMWMVNRDGRQWNGHSLLTIVPNWLHPQNVAQYNEIVADLSRTFGHCGHFRGIHGFLGMAQRDSYWIPSFGWQGAYDRPLEASFDDVTVALFEKQTGVRIAVDAADPDRFAKRAAILGAPALRERFMAWRSAALAEFLGQAVRRLRAQRNDLTFVNLVDVEGPDRDLFRYLTTANKPLAGLLREFAIDVEQLNRVDGLWTGRWTVSWRQAYREPFPSQDPYAWLARTSSDVVSAFPGEANRCVLVRTSWDENSFPFAGSTAGGARRQNDHLAQSDWIMNVETIRALPQPGGYHAREAFIQAIVTSDPQLLLGGFTDLNINVGHEQMLRSILTTFTHLPRERFQPVLDTGLESNLAIRQLTKDKETYFYVANPCQWHVAGSLTLETDGTVTELVGGKPVSVSANGGAKELAVKLTPFDLAAYRVSSPRLKITAYHTEPMVPEELARLRAVVDRVGTLAKDPVVKISLPVEDRQFAANAAQEAAGAVRAGQYARAWSLLTHWRVWSGWQEYLEKAAPLASDKPSRPQITYDAKRNCIQVVGFPEEEPATVDSILDADKKGRWGRVLFDRRTQTCAINAALWIGDDRSNGTFLQIGDKRRRNVTAVVNGTVWVRPPMESPKRSDGLDTIINRLTLGDPEDKNIRATLKIACRTPGEHGLYVGYRSADSKTWIRRGSLHVFNSTITAAQADKDHLWGNKDYTGEGASPRWASPGWYGSDIQIRNATISWFDGTPTYGMETGSMNASDPVDAMKPNPLMVIEGTTFEHGQTAIGNNFQYLEDCAFRDLEVGVREGGGLGAKLVRCTFEQNQSHWTAGSFASRGIIMVDCKIGPQKNPVKIQKNSQPHEALMKLRLPMYPTCRQRESLVVKVLDPAGKPASDATVLVRCKQNPEAVVRGAAVTDEAGLTPDDPESSAIVLTTIKYEATDDPNQPKTSIFGYEVTAVKDGSEPATVTLAPGKPLPRPLVLKLRN